MNRFRYHPDKTLPPTDGNWIFVFGSDQAGLHRFGAAAAARQHFGARTGVGSGPSGSCYAITTKDARLRPLTFDEVQRGVAAFIDFAIANPTRPMFVTRIGCGLARFEDQDVAPLFRGSPANCSFAQQWEPYLEGADGQRESMFDTLAQQLADQAGGIAAPAPAATAPAAPSPSPVARAPGPRRITTAQREVSTTSALELLFRSLQLEAREATMQKGAYAMRTPSEAFALGRCLLAIAEAGLAELDLGRSPDLRDTLLKLDFMSIFDAQEVLRGQHAQCQISAREHSQDRMLLTAYAIVMGRLDLAMRIHPQRNPAQVDSLAAPRNPVRLGILAEPEPLQGIGP